MKMPGRSFNLKTAEDNGTGYRYGFNGKEHDIQVYGSDGTSYDYGMRIYNPRIARFLSVDPLTKDYPSWSPYPFAMNRPIDGIDLDGLERYYTADGKLIGKYGKDQTIKIVDKNFVKSASAYLNWANYTKEAKYRKYALGKLNNNSQDAFDSKDKAAEDWGMDNNKKSIDEKREYVSNMFEVKIDGKKYTTTTKPAQGEEAGADPDDTPVPANKTRTGIIHSHGNYDPKYKNDEFSTTGGDIDYFESKNVDGYVTTPNGSLQKYNVNTNKQSTLSTKMPKDPIDPVKP